MNTADITTDEPSELDIERQFESAAGVSLEALGAREPGATQSTITAILDDVRRYGELACKAADLEAQPDDDRRTNEALNLLEARLWLALGAKVEAGAVVSDAQEFAAFESIVCEKAGPGAVAKWLGTAGYENLRVQDYREGWRWAIEWVKSLAATSTKPADEVIRSNALKEAADLCMHLENNLSDGADGFGADGSDCYAAIMALRAGLPLGDPLPPSGAAVKAEPVAQYQVRSPLGDSWSNVSETVYERILETEGTAFVRKLYATPQPPTAEGQTNEATCQQSGG